MEEEVRVELKQGTALVILNRPAAYNAFNLPMIRLLFETLAKMAMDDRVLGLVLSGQGKAFCAGGDLKWASNYGPHYAAAFHELAAYYHQAVLEIRRMPKPVVAAINGLAAGGGFSMALSCDFRIMEHSAYLKQGYTSNGLSIDGGGTFNLPRLVGMARALEIATFDRPIAADQALSWGLATEVVPDGDGVKRALRFVEELKKRPLSSFAASKRLLTDSFDTPLELQLERERAALSECAGHPNGREGITAFLEKRSPVFNKG